MESVDTMAIALIDPNDKLPPPARLSGFLWQIYRLGAEDYRLHIEDTELEMEGIERAILDWKEPADKLNGSARWFGGRLPLEIISHHIRLEEHDEAGFDASSGEYAWWLHRVQHLTDQYTGDLYSTEVPCDYRGGKILSQTTIEGYLHCIKRMPIQNPYTGLPKKKMADGEKRQTVILSTRHGLQAIDTQHSVLASFFGGQGDSEKSRVECAVGHPVRLEQMRVKPKGEVPQDMRVLYDLATGRQYIF